MREHECTAGCRCPNCDATMRAVASMGVDEYCRWLQATTAGMLAAAPKGPGIIGAEYRAMTDFAAAPTDSQPTPHSTPLSWIRASVERVRREMRAEKAERKAERTRQRVANETAVAYRAVSSRPVPDGYAEGLKKLGLPEPLPMIRDDDGVPLPYSTALRQR